MIKDARWQTLSFSLTFCLSLLFPLTCSQPSLLPALSLPLYSLPSSCTVTPYFFSSSHKAPSLLTPYFSHFLLVPHGVAFCSSFCPQLWQNLITHWFTSGCGEVNRGDKEGKDRSNEEGRWKGCSRESEGQMWGDKRERIGSRWKLSTNLKECSEKRRLLASCA